MKNNIYLLYNFNSYHNRVLKKFDTLTEYLNYQSSTSNSYDLIAGANFDYKDGVTATCTYNLSQGFDYDNSPNYVLVVDSSSNISSRWYVVDGVKTRGGQYALTLLRDGIADYLEDIKSAPMYVEKGKLSINDKPFIFNAEDINFNQIKKSETLLKDKTNCPWIVGFMAQKQPEGTTDPMTTQVVTNMMGQPDVTYSSMANYPYWAYMGNPWDNNENYYKALTTSGSAITTLTILVHLSISNMTNAYTYYYTPNGGWIYFPGGQTIVNSGDNQQTAFSTSGGNFPSLYRKIWRALNNTPQIAALATQYAATYGTGIHTAAQGDAFAAEAGKIVKTNGSATQPTTGKTYAAGVYSLSVPYSSSGNVYGNMVYQSDHNGDYEYSNTWVNTSSDLQTAIINMINANKDSTWELDYNGNYVTAGIAQEGKFYLVEATSTSLNSISFSFTGNEKGLGDAPYRMFALPYNDNIVKWKFGSAAANVTNSNKNINMSIAQGIAKTFSGTWLYDLQLVPFCPFVKSERVTVNSNDEVIIDVQNLTNVDYTAVQNGSGTLSYIIWCEYSQIDNYHIPYSIPTGSTPEDVKINNQCDMYRLSSPSYNSIFEFSAEMNGGVTYFDVDLAYKPFDSYIHINPNFGGLYGDDFNDARGLVFTGPFQLPQTTSSWMQYKMNNMNYQNTFDRQIQNMDTMHDIEMKELKWKIAAGTVTGAASGAAAGAMAGGVGAIVGGIVGAGASLAGGMMDKKYAEQKYSETIDYTKDQFNYSLQNVKAQATTLSKVSSFTPNNKVFPVLEYYTCTDAEKDAFREKLKYNGMSINVITTLDTLYSSWSNVDDLKRYTKGKLIRLNVEEDNHLVEHISEELNKGVFL